MAFRVAQLQSGPIADWAAADRHVSVTAVLVSDPSFVARPGFGGTRAQQVRVELRVEQVTAGTEYADVRTPVLAIGDGDGWRPLRFGDTIDVSGKLGSPEAAQPLAAVLITDTEPIRVAPAPAVLRGAETMRSGLRDAVSGLPSDVQGLLPALVVGDTSAMPSLLTSDLRDAGLAHLTAVSGANVAMVVGAALLLARWAGVRAYALVALGLVVVVWFVLLARPQPSVLRAAVMGSVALVAVGAVGRTQAVRSMLAAVVALLLIDPWLARSWGFTLSVAATAGLVLLARRWSERLPARWPRPVRDATAVALAAQVATLPLVTALSGQVALLSVIANLLAAPAVPAATVLGAAAAAVSPFAPWLASPLAWVGQWPAAWIADVANWAATRPFATVTWPDGWSGGLLSLALMVVAVSLWRCGVRRKWWRPSRLVPAALAAGFLVGAYLLGPGRWPPPGWVVVACDVGQGDAVAVNLGERAAMVVDAGPDPGLADRCLDRLGIDHIPLLVLTHFHADHVEGLPGVLDSRVVDAVLVSSLRDPPEQVDEVARWTAGMEVVEAAPGQEGQWGTASWQVLWPGEPVVGEGSAANNASVVLLVEVSGVRLLLTGDVEPEAQHALLETGVPAVDVLKVPHHGSSHQDGEFLARADADVALISVGEGNTYGHPDSGLVEALLASGVAVARTDQQGTVAVVAEDGALRVVSQP
jgi:competence protein ComEC